MHQPGTRQGLGVLQDAHVRIGVDRGEVGQEGSEIGPLGCIGRDDEVAQIEQVQ